MIDLIASGVDILDGHFVLYMRGHEMDPTLNPPRDFPHRFLTQGVTQTPDEVQYNCAFNH